MPELVDRLFERPLEEQILVGRFAVEFGSQAVQGDDGASLHVIGAAEDELVRRLVEIVLGYTQKRCRRSCRTPTSDRVNIAPKNNCLRTLLSVLLGTRSVDRTFRGEEKTLFQAQREA